MAAAEMPGHDLNESIVELDLIARELLGGFYLWLQAPGGGSLDPFEASPLALEADRYARDFLIEILEYPAVSSTRRTVLAYLSNWYIINTLEPSRGEMEKIARALSLFHTFLRSLSLAPGEECLAVERLLAEPERFHKRLDDFWELTAEQVADWRGEDDYRRLTDPKGD